MNITFFSLVDFLSQKMTENMDSVLGAAQLTHVQVKTPVIQMHTRLSFSYFNRLMSNGRVR